MTTFALRVGRGRFRRFEVVPSVRAFSLLVPRVWNSSPFSNDGEFQRLTKVRGFPAHSRPSKARHLFHPFSHCNGAGRRRVGAARAGSWRGAFLVELTFESRYVSVDPNEMWLTRWSAVLLCVRKHTHTHTLCLTLTNGYTGLDLPQTRSCRAAEFGLCGGCCETVTCALRVGSACGRCVQRTNHFPNSSRQGLRSRYSARANMCCLKSPSSERRAASRILVGVLRMG